MKPAAFAYERPGTLGEALEALARHGSDARPLAGGQSLVPMLSLRLARPALLVDLGRLAGLDELVVRNGAVEIGAMVRQRRLERDPLVAQHVPVLAAATRYVGHPSIRNRGTLGGSLAHADPSAEYPAVALAVDAEMVVRSARGERTIPARDFFLGPFTTALAEGELLVAIRFPALPAGAGWGDRGDRAAARRLRARWSSRGAGAWAGRNVQSGERGALRCGDATVAGDRGRAGAHRASPGQRDAA
jgi:carbon-monoxide dehydrogenase medium subunit